MIADSLTQLGLDELGLQIVRRRLPILLSHLSRWREADGQSPDQLLQPDNRGMLIDWFTQFESNIQLLASTDLAAVRNGLTDWLKNYLLPLTQELDLYPLATEHVLVLLYNQGYFDQHYLRGSPKLSNGQRLQVHRPPRQDILPQVLRVVETFTEQTAQEHELLRRGFCRDAQVAYHVIHAFDRDREDSQLNRIALGLTHSLILSFLEYDAIGLLSNSEHPCANLLISLERRQQTTARLTKQPDIVFAVVRADLLAIHKVLANTPQLDGSGKRRRNGQKKHEGQTQSLWQEDLLFQPLHAADRREYRARITPEQWITLVTKLAHERGSSRGEAQQLLEILIAEGLEGLINWRCASTEQLTQDTFHFLRLRESIERHLSGFHPDARQKITEMLRILDTLIDELHIPLDLAPLLDAQPGGRKRAIFASRVPYNPYAAPRPAPKKSKSTLKPKRRWGYRPPRDPKIDAFRAAFATHINQLAKAFGARIGLTELQARARLRSLGDYGGIGLLPKKNWPDALDPLLVSYLYFLKFGPVSGTLHDAVILELANEYANELEVPHISMQIARAIFSTQVKVRRWNGGVGDSMISVRQRPSLKLSKTGLLNRIWRLFPVRLRLKVAKSAHSAASKDCYAIIVLDLSSQRPIGCWVSIAEPQIEEASLALFHAIWHPGMPNWPIRGFPEIIQVPKSLVSSGSVTTVERAAYRMRAKVQIVADDTKRALLRKLTYAENLLERAIEFDGCAFIREKAEGRPLPIKVIQDRLVEWLRFGRRTEASPGCFPNHRSADVPAAFRKKGYTLPAHNSPAAGWLLPVVDTITTVRDGVRFNDRLYSSPRFRTEPGMQVKIRAFPYRYSPMPQSIFVEEDGGRLVYLAVDKKEV